VTFGARRPVILLPPDFPDLPAAVQRAMACHELLHVRRSDWLFMVAEEVIRAVLWFHPAVWWVLAQIQLAREEVVDRAVVELTESREQYVETLLRTAGQRIEPDLAPAPLFFRKRHLARRVATLMKETAMSKRQLILSLTAGGALVALAGGIAVRAFPLQAPADSSGVQVRSGAPRLLHRAPVLYPPAAKEKGIQGSVVVELRVNEKGNVADARVLSGPEELRAAALESVLKWHYSTEGVQLPANLQATIDFQLAEPGRDVPRGVPGSVREGAAVEFGLLKRIDASALPADLREKLLSALPVKEGDRITGATLTQIGRAAQAVDEHIRMHRRMEDGVVLYFSLPQAAAADEPRIRVGGGVQATLLKHSVRPEYPPLAKQARIQGTVRLEAVIGKDGTVRNLTVVSGHPLLVPPSLEAVRQWVYEPTLLNGEPVEVITMIDVNFTLAE